MSHYVQVVWDFQAPRTCPHGCLNRFFPHLILNPWLSTIPKHLSQFHSKNKDPHIFHSNNQTKNWQNPWGFMAISKVPKRSWATPTLRWSCGLTPRFGRSGVEVVKKCFLTKPATSWMVWLSQLQTLYQCNWLYHVTSWWLNHPAEKYARQIGTSSPIFGVKIMCIYIYTYIWNHHLALHRTYSLVKLR